MNPAIGSALVTGGLSLLGNAFGFGSQQSTNAKQIELAKYQNQWNEMMWNKQNAYNSPVQQMQRLKAAGLNPNLVYGNGGASQAGNSAHAAAGANVPSLGAYTNFGDLGATASVNAYNNARLTDASVQAQQARARLDNNKANTEQYETSVRAIKVAQDFLNYAISNDLAPTTIAKAKQDLKNAEQSYRESVQRVSESESRIEVNDSKVRLNEKELLLKDESIKLIQEQQGVARATAAAKYQDIRESVSRILLNKANEDFIKSRKKGQDIQNYINEETDGDQIELITNKLIEYKLKNDKEGFKVWYLKRYHVEPGGSGNQVVGIAAPLVSNFESLWNSIF